MSTWLFSILNCKYSMWYQYLFKDCYLTALYFCNLETWYLWTLYYHRISTTPQLSMNSGAGEPPHICGLVVGEVSATHPLACLPPAVSLQRPFQGASELLYPIRSTWHTPYENQGMKIFHICSTRNKMSLTAILQSRYQHLLQSVSLAPTSVELFGELQWLFWGAPDLVQQTA